MSGTRMPEDIPGAVAFIVRTDNFLQIAVLPTNGNRLGLSNPNVAEWRTKREAIDLLYLKWCDDSQKTKTVNADIIILLDEFRTFVNPQLNVIAASNNLTSTDEAVFNLVGDNNHKAPAHRESKILELCNSTIKPISAGDVVNHVKSDPASKRDHIFEGSTGFECAFSITDTATTLADPENATRKSFTKAAVVMELGALNKGKYLNHCERWVYGPNPHFNGSWSNSQSILID